MKTFLFFLKAHALGLVLLFFAGFLSQQGFGQVANYTFAATTGTYGSVSGGTSLSSILADDATSRNIPIGFTFTYNGSPYTQLSACSNGWVSLSNSSSTDYKNSLSSGGGNSGNITQILAPLWDDLKGSNGSGGTTPSASYLTTGSVGSRVFTIEWKNWRWDVSSSNDVISFELKLYEGTNIIEFWYQRGANNVNNGSNGASIGISGAVGDYLSLNGTGSNPLSSSSTETSNLSSRPATGQVYRFAPAANLSVSAASLTFSNQVSGTTSVSQNFNLSGVNLAGFPSTITVTASSTDFQVSNNNSSWGSSTTIAYSSATLSATPVYVRFAPQSTGAKSGSVTLSGGGDASPPTVAVSGTGTAAAASDIIAAGNEAAGIVPSQTGTTIPSTGSGTRVWSFTVRDGGGTADGDNLPTILNAVTITPGAGNGLTWTNTIQEAALFNGSTFIANVSLSANQIVFTGLSGANVTAPIGGGVTLDLYVTFKTGTVVDDQQLQFQISSATAASSGSSNFGSFTSTSSSVSGTNNKINITATKLLFGQQPSNVLGGIAMSPAVTIKAVDANNNVDIDYATAVNITTTASFAGTATTSVTPVSGVASFNNLIFSAAGTAFTLAGSSGSLTATGNSTTTFNVTASASSNIIVKSGYVYPQNIAYGTYQSSSITTGNTAGSLEIAQFTIQDGGGSPDADVLSTTLTSVTFTISNYANIQKIAIYDASSNIVLAQSAPGTGTVTFSGLSLVANDGGSKDFSILVSFNSSVTDDQHIGLTITSATAASTGSGFAAGNAGGAATSVANNDNKIQVSATKLLFVQQPSNVLAGSQMSPAVTIKAVDGNNNTDLDYATSVTITTTATFSGSATTSVTPSSGVASFGNLIFAAAGTGFTLAGSSGALAATGNSTTTFNVTASASSNIIVKSGYVYNQNIAYGNYQVASIPNGGAGSIELAQFSLQDGGGSDADNLSTTLTSLTFSISNYANVREVAIYDPSTNTVIAQAAGAASITFNSLNIVAGDNGTKIFSIRASFNTAVTDGQYIGLTITSATAASTGSGFASGSAGGAATSVSGNNNKIVVTATNLVFVQQPSDVAQDDPMSPAVAIKEVDALGNLDTHTNMGVIISSTAAFTTTATKTATPVSGVATFSNLIFSSVPGVYTISGAPSSGTITATGSSNTFNITAFVSKPADYFKSAASADWAVNTTWQASHDNSTYFAISSYPTNAATAIAIQNGHSVAVSTSVSGEGITVPTGASVNINSGGTLAVANGSGTDLSITGSGIVNVNSGGTLANSGTISSSASTLVVANGGTYQHSQNGGAIPTATWGVSSTCYITGITTTAPSGLTASFGNLTWYCTGQVFVDDGFGVGVDQGISIGSVTTNGSFNLKSTGSSFIDITALTVKGAYVQSGGTIVDFSNASPGNSNTTGTLSVAGDFSMSGGSMGANSAYGNATFNVVFNGSTTQHFVKTGGTIITTNQFTGNTLTNNFTINNGAIVDFSTYVLNGTGTFTLSSGGSLITANSNGLGSSGSIQLTGTKLFSAAANYTFSGSGTQSTGTNFPTPLTGNLTITNSNTATGVTITNTAQTINGTLNIAAGSILTLPTATSTTTLGGAINTNSTGVINAGTTSTLVINGSGTISSPLVFGTNTFSVFTLNRTGSVLTLGSALNTAALNLTNGKIDASAYVLTLTTNATIGGFSGSNYVITGNGSGNGYLQINNLVAGTLYTFPIGTSAYYLPANVKPVTGGLNWTSKVFSPATTNGAYSGPAYTGSALQSIVNAVWDIQPNPEINTTAAITVNWVDALEGSVFNTYVDSYIGISHYTGGAWQGGTATGGASNSTDYATSTFTSFSPFGVGSISNPLPVVLVGFDAVLNNNKTVDVSWTTEQEVNSSHFEIERSADGTHWQTIGTVQAKGNSSLPSDYGYADEIPLDGINYYRLKMVNIAGDFGYTTIRIIRTMQAKGINIFPNPARNYVNISVSQAAADLNVRLINQSGQVLQTAKINAGGSSTISLQVQNYPQGTYLLQITGADGTQQTSKVVIMR